MSLFETDALALASPSGRISKRALKNAQERIRRQLFGPDGIQVAEPMQSSEREANLAQAARLRKFASLHPRKYIKEAERLEAKWK